MNNKKEMFATKTNYEKVNTPAQNVHKILVKPERPGTRARHWTQVWEISSRTVHRTVL